MYINDVIAFKNTIRGATTKIKTAITDGSGVQAAADIWDAQNEICALLKLPQEGYPENLMRAIQEEKGFAAEMAKEEEATDE